MSGRARIPLTGTVPPTRQDRRLEVFAAYPYNIEGYREMLTTLESSANVKFRFADDTPSATHLTSAIGNLLTRCSVAMFDLTGWNANVAFEFGIVVGMVGMNQLHNVWLLLKTDGEGPDMPSDIRGLKHTRYNSLDDLRSKLEVNLSQKFPVARSYAARVRARAPG